MSSNFTNDDESTSKHLTEHLGNIYEEGELFREATIRKFRIVRMEGARQVTRDVESNFSQHAAGRGWKRKPRMTR